MAITQSVRDCLLLEARHRCTICAEPAYELHHLIEQSHGGDDSEENLIVLCPNCHQQRVHRNKELSLVQLRKYKSNLKEKNEVEKRLLLNLESIVSKIDELGIRDAQAEVSKELSEAASLIDKLRSPSLYATIEQTARWLAEHDSLKLGARRALEIQCDLNIQRELAKFSEYSIIAIDEDGWSKVDDFPAAYRFVVKLSGRPYSEWCDVFENEYKTSLYMTKRKSRVVGDRIEMIVANSDNLQNHVDYLKQLVESSNARILDGIERTLKPRLQRDKQRVLGEFDSIESLKDRTKGLVI